jgi:hypothetical protein
MFEGLFWIEVLISIILKIAFFFFFYQIFVMRNCDFGLNSQFFQVSTPPLACLLKSQFFFFFN